MASVPLSTWETSSIWRPATPPLALMSATTAFMVVSALPISGARFCSVSWDRSAEIIETLTVVSVRPTVLPTPSPEPATVVSVAEPPSVVLAVQAAANRQARTTKPNMRRVFCIEHPPGYDVE